MNREDFVQKLSKVKEKIQCMTDRDVYVWGVGATWNINAECFEREKIYPKLFVDNRLGGGKKNGIRIIKGSELQNEEEREKAVIIACSTNPKTAKSILGEIEALGLIGCTFTEFIWGRHTDEIIQVYDMLEDECSKEIFSKIVISRMESKEVPEECFSPNQYFAIRQFRRFDQEEVFCDLGAYVGDTIEEYLKVRFGSFKKIYAFEPSEKNRQAMAYRVERLKREWNLDDDSIELVDGGAGLYTEMKNFSDAGDTLGARVTTEAEKNGYTVQIYSLDDYFSEKKVSFIKADIEGAEYDMLKGATQLIEKQKPLLAICVYHRIDDIFSIPLLIRSIYQEYKFRLRHHTFCDADTVLYAYVD